MSAERAAQEERHTKAEVAMHVTERQLDGKCQLVSSLMEGAVRGGASRHTAAATAAALLRVATSSSGEDEEVSTRIALIEPVLRKKARVGIEGRKWP